MIFLLNKLRNVNSVTSFKKKQKNPKKTLSVLVTGKMWMQTDVLVYCQRHVSEDREWNIISKKFMYEPSSDFLSGITLNTNII